VRVETRLRHAVRQPRNSYARLEIDGLGPTPKQPILGGIGDAINASRHAPGRGAVNRAGAAATARAMNIEEDGAISLAKTRAIDPAQWTANGVEHTGGDMAGNNGIWHA